MACYCAPTNKEEKQPGNKKGIMLKTRWYNDAFFNIIQKHFYSIYEIEPAFLMEEHLEKRVLK